MPDESAQTTPTPVGFEASPTDWLRGLLTDADRDHVEVVDDEEAPPPPAAETIRELDQLMSNAHRVDRVADAIFRTLADIEGPITPHLMREAAMAAIAAADEIVVEVIPRG